MTEVAVRRAVEADIAAITETVSTAFHHDPVWAWAFPDPNLRPEQYSRWWPIWIEAGLRNDSVWVTDGCEAAAVWTPPGASELNEEDEARLVSLLNQVLGAHADEVLEGIARFEAAHPRDEPHWCLSIVATHTDHRGRGIGVALLEENLRHIDEQRFPAYLESTNPANLERYQRLGFAVCGEFSMPAGGPGITTMWRDAAT
jgi:GNAT superfamily N-acetyltransferase